MAHRFEEKPPWDPERSAAWFKEWERKRAHEKASAPREVKEVYRAAQQSAKEAGLPEDATSFSLEDGVYTIADNYERFSSHLLSWKSGGWTIRSMYSGEPSKSISHAEALENARLMFHG